MLRNSPLPNLYHKIIVSLFVLVKFDYNTVHTSFNFLKYLNIIIISGQYLNMAKVDCLPVHLKILLVKFTLFDIYVFHRRLFFFPTSSLRKTYANV